MAKKINLAERISESSKSKFFGDFSAAVDGMA